MAVETALKPAVRRLAQGFRRYAAARGWSRDDYRIYVETKAMWGRIGVIFVARTFPGRDEYDQWVAVMHFLLKDLHDEPELLASLNLVLRTFDQIDQDETYRVSSGYEDVDGVFPSGRTD